MPGAPAQARFGSVAEALESGLEQWGGDAGWAFEGELGGGGYLSSGRQGPEGHSVNGDDGLVLPATSNELLVCQFIDDVDQLDRPAEKC